MEARERETFCSITRGKYRNSHNATGTNLTKYAQGFKEGQLMGQIHAENVNKIFSFPTSRS